MIRTILVVITFSLSACATTNYHSDILFVRAGKMQNGSEDRIYQNIDLVILNGRFASIGKDLKMPTNARLLDWRAFMVQPAEGTFISEGLPASLVARDENNVGFTLRNGVVSRDSGRAP